MMHSKNLVPFPMIFSDSDDGRVDCDHAFAGLLSHYRRAQGVHEAEGRKDELPGLFGRHAHSQVSGIDIFSDILCSEQHMTLTRDKESIPKELLDAFRGMDPGRRGVIPAKDLWNILVKWGEKLSAKEGECHTRSAFT